MLWRRMFPQALLAVSVVILLVLSACGGATPPAATPTATAKAAATPTPSSVLTPPPATQPTSTSQPKYGGTLRQLTYGPEVVDWDVFRRLSGNPGTNAYTVMFNTLMEWDRADHLRPAPGLADSFTVSSDGSSYTFKLHPGVTWQDGKPFTADDVVATFEQAIAKWVLAAHGSRTGGYLADIVAGAKAVDPLTATVTLKAPDSTFGSFVTSYLLVMVPKHILDANGGSKSVTALAKWTPFGTGPFKLKAYDPSIRLAYERNPTYWRKDAAGSQQPYLDAIELPYIQDGNLQFAAIRTGKFDLWPNGYPIVADSTAAKLKEALGSKIVIVKANASLQDTLDFNLKGPLTGQKDFRQAINLIADRDELKLRAYEGNLLAGAILDPSIHGDSALTDAELRTMPGMRAKAVDHEEARKLLAKLNVTAQNPATIRITGRNIGVYGLGAQALVPQLKPFNIILKVELYEQAAGSAILTRGDFDIDYDPDPAYIPDPWFLLDIQYITKPSDRPEYTWLGPAQDQVRTWMNETRATTDQAKRKAIFQQLQRFILTNGDIPSAVVGYEQTNVVWYDYVKGYVVMGGIYEGLRDDYVWIDRK